MRARRATSIAADSPAQRRTRSEDQRTRQAASRAVRWASIEGEAFRYNPGNNYEDYPQFDIGRMANACMYCGALKWIGEAPGICCAGGKIRLTPLQPSPEPLASLMSGTTPRSKYFLEHIQKYNCCFQMTSFDATNEVCEPGFMPTFRA